MKSLLNWLLHIFVVIGLTLLSQIGGLTWLLFYVAPQVFWPKLTRRFKLLIFGGFYLILTLFLIPNIAKSLGRVALPIQGGLKPHNLFTVLLNRHYVTPTLKKALLKSTDEFQTLYPNVPIKYLDANFPFYNGFPLLPHLSHNDGKKIDLCFLYNQRKILSSQKPSRSGYGVFENPDSSAPSQSEICIGKGYWQYDFTKYITLGSRSGFEFNATATADLISILLRQEANEKILLEPHLKIRMGLNDHRVRFQGCRAVRHDDHIHFQTSY